MLTQAVDGVDAGAMLSIGEIADRERVSKQAVSTHVKRLVERHGLRVERDMQGRVARVAIAEYDALRNRFADPSKVQAPSRVAPLHRPEDSYDEALRRKTLYEAERRRLELDQLKGRLVSVDALSDALDRAAELAKDALAAIEDCADEIAAAVARDGARGVRAELKRLRAEIEGRQLAAFVVEARKLRDGIHIDVQEGSEARQ